MQNRPLAVNYGLSVIITTEDWTRARVEVRTFLQAGPRFLIYYGLERPQQDIVCTGV